MIDPASILIVDEEPECLHFLSRILAGKGYRVRCAHDGDTAICAVAREPPDLLLIDLRLPAPTGLELGRRFKANRRLQPVPIVFMGSPQEEEAREAWRAGAADLLYKPLREHEVLARVASCFERARRQQKRASRNLEAAGLIAVGAAHDFSNLLNSILIHVDTSLDETSTASDIRQSLESIRTVAIRASELVLHVMNAAGSGTIDFEPTDLCALVAEIVAVMRPSIPEECRIETEFPEGSYLVRANPVQIRQVVLNLIQNAADAIGINGGVIALKLSAVRAAGRDRGLPAGEYVRLDVCDTGCGMNEDTRARIFETFFTTKFEGHGLGLAALEHIVAGHGGRISFDSEPGRGTTFHVLLPSWREAAAAHARGGREGEGTIGQSGGA